MPQYNKTTWVNDNPPAIDATNLNKMEQGIYDSLRQDGSTTMSGQLVTTAGSAATPAIAPTGDSNTGIFFPASETIAFSTNGSERVRVNSSGQVGIGIDPTNKLHLYQNNTNQQYISISNATSTILVGQDSSGNMVNYTNQAVNYQWSNSGTPRMTITSSGTVGIGTTTPTALVSMHGAPQATSGAILTLRDTTATGANTTYGAITFLSSPGTDFSIGKASENANSALAFRNANTGAEFMRIDSNGYVSIGATSAGAAKLRVEDASSAKIYSVRTGGATLLIEGGSASGFVKTITNSNLNLGANNTDYMTISSAGNVGIGTTNPSKQLHVKSGTAEILRLETTVARGSGSNFIQFNDPTGSKGFVGYGNTNDIIYLSNDLNQSLSLRTNATDRVFITGEGNVGIGTTSPSAELHVKGSGEVVRLETTNATGSNYLSFFDSSANKGNIGYSTATDEFRIQNMENADMTFWTNGTTRFTLEAGGTLRPAANNTYDLGSATYRWATIYAQNALNTSDLRLKTDVAPSSLGLDFINQLNPVQYRWIEGGNSVERVQTGTEMVEITPAIPAQPEQLEVLDEEGNVIQEYKPAVKEVPAVTEEQPVYEEVVTPREGVRTHFGLIAQEVKAALPDGLDFAGWCLADKDDADSTQSLGYMQLIAPMIKAIQELNAKVEALEAQLNK